MADEGPARDVSVYKAPPHTTQYYRGPNHILVSRRSRLKSVRSKVLRLLDSGMPEVHLHGLGAALGPAVIMAAQLVRDSGGRLVDSCTTSTEMLVDRSSNVSDLSESTSVRFNSAVHIRLAYR